MRVRYDTILLDADNTLLDFTRSEHDALLDCLAARGLDRHAPSTEEAIACYAAINDGWWKRLERRETTRAELAVGRFADFIAAWGLDCDAASLARNYMDTLATKSFLVDGALPFCEHLHPHCRLYLITNGTTYIQHGRWDPTPLAPLFRDVFISQDIGADKPSRAYFDYVTARIPDFDPARTLVVGDSLSSDVQGGINAGLDTCWYNPRGKQAPDGLPVTYICAGFDDIENVIFDRCSGKEGST